MIVLQSPQFTTQDDSGHGDGIAPTPLWYQATTSYEPSSQLLLDTLDLEPVVTDIVRRLRVLFHQPEQFPMSTTEFHDLTCFVLHRLLGLTPSSTLHKGSGNLQSRSECVRFATALYLLHLHGPTYFSHAGLQYNLAVQLKAHLEDCLDTLLPMDGSLVIWFLSIGLLATSGTPDYEWFRTQATAASSSLGARAWEDILPHLKNILWMEKHHIDCLFLQNWQCAWEAAGS